jgi:hypothetical protein
MVGEIHRSSNARGFVAVYTTLGLLKLRLGALPEADAAARVALRVMQEGDFRPGLAFAVTVLADVAVEAGDIVEAEALLWLLPQEGWPAGVGTVLIPAARGRLRLAQGRPADALVDFATCTAMFSAEVWGTEIRDVGYLHARSGAALALLRLGERERARDMAQGELAEVKAFGGPRALGVALRVAGLAQGGSKGLELLGDSVASLRSSPALLERAHSLAELGAALQRDGRRSLAREPLAEALDLAARCGARPLAARVREELKAAGARPRRVWRTGLEALSPRELRVVQLGRRRPDQPRNRLPALRDAQDRRGPPGARIHETRDRAPPPAGEVPRRRKNQGTHPLANALPHARPSGSGSFTRALQFEGGSYDDYRARSFRKGHGGVQRARHERFC